MNKKAFKVAAAVTVSAVVIGLILTAIFEFFGNPLERKSIRNIAEQYIAENYSEMNPRIVDIDYDAKYIGYQVEVYLEKSGKTFTLRYYESGELGWDSYGFSTYEEKYGKVYFEEGLYGVRDLIGTPKNEKQKAVLAVINFDFEIQNGGLCQYLVNEDNENIIKITEYLHMVGAEKQADFLEAFTAENDIELKSAEIKNTDDYIRFENSKPFDEFDRAYMDAYTPDEEWKADFSGQIMGYIQENIEDF